MRLTTYERMQATGRLVVVKKDGSRQPYDRANVLQGIIAACGKRPVSEDRKESVADADPEAYDREVPSVEIGRRVAANFVMSIRSPTSAMQASTTSFRRRPGQGSQP